ncbi:MAG: hypothetical protein ACE5JN_11245 [Candidatus Methylomirabilia bacterium]
MGFYLGSERRRGLTKDLSPTITPGEYVAALSRVIRALAVRPNLTRQCYQAGLLYLTTALPRRAVQVFSDVVRRQPKDRAAHRLLGIAHLHEGNPEAAVRHLEIALQLLRCEAAAMVGLREALSIQCETALLRLLLVPLNMSLGRVRAAYLLVKEGRGL